MLGLGDSYGVRTYVYSDKKIVPKEDAERQERQRLQEARKVEELDDSIDYSVLTAYPTGESSYSVGDSQAGGSGSRIDWASGYKTTVITQTSE